MRKFLLFILFLVLAFALVYKSPFSALYNYNKAKLLYDSSKYEQSLPYFERSLFADRKGILARFYYVLALSKSKPFYSVQKKLYEMSQSDIQDEAYGLAKAKTRALRYKLLEGISDNYIFNAAMGNDVLRWDIRSFPLKVFIEQDNSVPKYYYSAIETALDRWSGSTNFISFNLVQNPDESDIYINFKDITKQDCDGEVCHYTAAHTEPDIDKNKILKRMNLTFYKTNPLNKYFTDLEIYNTALHEIGHTLGIMGHSDNPADIMYAEKNNNATRTYYNAYNSLSRADVRTLVLLYRIKPTISNVKDLNSENFYYAPLIIGEDEERLQKKLSEYQKYVETYPQISSGYINLASVYADLGDFDSAEKTLETAGKYAKNQDEEYLVNYNKAVVYFNTQKYPQALDYAQKAREIKTDDSIEELITEIKSVSSK